MDQNQCFIYILIQFKTQISNSSISANIGFNYTVYCPKKMKQLGLSVLETSYDALNKNTMFVQPTFGYRSRVSTLTKWGISSWTRKKLGHSWNSTIKKDVQLALVSQLPSAAKEVEAAVRSSDQMTDHPSVVEEAVAVEAAAVSAGVEVEVGASYLHFELIYIVNNLLVIYL